MNTDQQDQKEVMMTAGQQTTRSAPGTRAGFVPQWWCFFFILITGVLGEQPGLGATRAAVETAGSIQLKVIVSKPTQIFSRPDPSSESAPCDPFSFWYVLPPHSEIRSRRYSELATVTENGFYKVATSDSEAAFTGWIPAADAVEWHHRQALTFAPQVGRKPALFYQTRSDAIAAVETGETSLAVHREPRSSGSLALMPLLDAAHVDVNGERLRLYRVAFMSRSHDLGELKTTSRYKRKNPEQRRTREEVLRHTTFDLVFVIDTTRSMREPIGQVRSSVGRVVEALAGNEQLRTRLRLGLVGFRDMIEHRPIGYVAKVFCDLEDGADHDYFLRRLERLSVASTGSDDYAEDVLAGLHAAIDQKRMKWNEIRWKQIIVVGDSSVKEPEHPRRESRKSLTRSNIADTKRLAEGADPITSQVVVSAIRIKDPDHTEDHFIGDRQFNNLVAGRRYTGHLISVRGGSEPEDFSRKLTDNLLTALANLGALIERGNLDIEETALDGLPKQAWLRPFPIITRIRNLPSEAHQNKSGAAEQLNFESQYCTELDHLGNRQFIPAVFVRKGQLSSFLALLEFLLEVLADAGEPGSRDVQQVVEQMQRVSMTLQLDEPVDGHVEIGTLLEAALELPITTDIFKVSLARLAAMSSKEYSEWIESVRLSTFALVQIADNPRRWFKLRQGNRDRDEHGFIPLADMP